MRLDADMAVSLSTLAFLHWQGPDGSAGSEAAASVVPRTRTVPASNPAPEWRAGG